MKKLSPEVSEFYNLITIRPGSYSFPGFGQIDLTTLSLTEAHELVSKGFQFLVPKIIGNPEKNQIPFSPITDDQIYYLPSNKTNAPALNLFGVVSHSEHQPLLNRNNKKYINKLLTLNYSDLEFKEKALFLHDEKYFFEKKMLLQDASSIFNEMKSLHAKLKAAKSDSERKEINADLWQMDDARQSTYEKLDFWREEATPENAIEKAAREAVERQNEIKTLTNYIGRFEYEYNAMPEGAKKQKKLSELSKRHARLIYLGAQYSRKKRS